jgi:hypothetical protein
MAKSKGNLPYNCKFNQAVGCADLKGCHRCGWNPDVAFARKAALNAKPKRNTHSKAYTLAVTWRERKR